MNCKNNRKGESTFSLKKLAIKNSFNKESHCSGKCSNCNGKIIFTISEGGIVKYLAPATKLAETYAIPVYVKQNIEMTKKYIESIFGKEDTKQVELSEWL